MLLTPSFTSEDGTVGLWFDFCAYRYGSYSFLVLHILWMPSVLSFCNRALASEMIHFLRCHTIVYNLCLQFLLLWHLLLLVVFISCWWIMHKGYAQLSLHRFWICYNKRWWHNKMNCRLKKTMQQQQQIKMNRKKRKNKMQLKSPKPNRVCTVHAYNSNKSSVWFSELVSVGDIFCCCFSFLVYKLQYIDFYFLSQLPCP